MLRTSQPDALLTTYLFLLCKVFEEVNQLGLEFIVLWEKGRRGGEGGDWDLTALCVGGTRAHDGRLQLVAHGPAGRRGLPCQHQAW